MNDDSSGNSRLWRRYRYEANRKPKSKGVFFRAALWLGIIACLAASTVFLTDRSRTQESMTASAVKLSANDISPDAAQSGSIFTDSAINPKLILGTEMPVIYGVDLKEISPKESQITEQPQVNFDVISEDIKMEILRFSGEAQQNYSVGTEGPQVLIYHTHTREAYFETDEAMYNAGQYQTTDYTHSVTVVGEMLKQELESYGFTVIHDMTDHVPPKQSTSYSRSLDTMLTYQQQYPTLRIFIDLHRDAYGNGYPPPEAGQNDFVTVDSRQCARVMCVVGTGENYEGAEKPNYESNYKLAQAFTNEMEHICEDFTRPVRVKSGRYNQQVSDMCLLFEVGHNANTLEQAVNSAKYIAKALSRVVNVGG